MSSTSENTEEIITRRRETPGAINSLERYWRRHQKWLEKSGYMLRPRYKPEWVPSWTGTKRDYSEYEDGQMTFVSYSNTTFIILA